MYDLSDREIELMDKILELTISYDKQGLWKQGTKAQILNISEEEYQFLVDRIVALNYPKIVNVLDEETDYQSISNCYETQRFMDKGGFRQLLDKQKTNVTGFIGNTIGSNFSGNTIIIGDNNKNQSSSSLNKKKKNKSTIWKWVISIIGLFASIATIYAVLFQK